MRLVRYDAARQALAEAHRVDEVKDLRDKAEALAAYARQARDNDMLQWATEIKVRAERKCGELLKLAAENGERATRSHGGANVPTVSNDTTPCTLSDIGLTRDQSSRFQKLAAMPDEHFETAVATAKEHVGHVTTAFLLRAAGKRDATPPKDEPRGSRLFEDGSPFAAMTVSAQIVLLIERINPADPRATEALDAVEKATARRRAALQEINTP